MTENDPTEVWKPVIGYEGLYEVSNLGRVKRIAPFPHRSRYAIGVPRIGAKNIRGYRDIRLIDHNGEKRQTLVHRIVVEAFIGPIPKGMTVNHLDSVRDNNRVLNLEIATYSRQMRHMQSMGRAVYVRGTKHGLAKLTDKDVIEIRSRHVSGCRINGAHALGITFGVSESTITNVIRGKIWRHVK